MPQARVGDRLLGVLLGAIISIVCALGGAMVGANLSVDGSARQQTRALQAETYSSYLAANTQYFNAQLDIAESMSAECLNIAVNRKVSTDCQPTPALSKALDAAVSIRYLAVRQLDMVADETVAELATEIEVRNGHTFNSLGLSVAPWIAQRQLDRQAGAPQSDDTLNASLIRAMSCTISGRAFVYDESGKVISTEECP